MLNCLLTESTGVLSQGVTIYFAQFIDISFLKNSRLCVKLQYLQITRKKYVLAQQGRLTRASMFCQNRLFSTYSKCATFPPSVVVVCLPAGGC